MVCSILEGASETCTLLSEAKERLTATAHLLEAPRGTL